MHWMLVPSWWYDSWCLRAVCQGDGSRRKGLELVESESGEKTKLVCLCAGVWHRKVL